MRINVPTLDELARIADECGLTIESDELKAYRELITVQIESYIRIEAVSLPASSVKYAPRSGWRPRPEENPLTAWYWRTELHGASDGPLKGKTLAIKDSVCVAGLPMMNGSVLLEGYVPETDATIVTRILDAGGTILGKSVCESLCFAGGSHTSDSGTVLNPYDLKRTPGGSSTGSAALVASSAVDMAIGGDQAGSIRVPASWSGIYGIKPTYGLVPYTGICPIEITLDHVGPLARTVADLALLLDVIAGPDDLDPRQRNVPGRQNFSSDLTDSVRGLRLGVVENGFELPGQSQKDVDDAVREAVHAFERLGARVTTLSIPWHRCGLDLWSAIALEGASTMVQRNSAPTNWGGPTVLGLIDAFAIGRATRNDALSATAKLVLLTGTYMQKKYHGRFYAKAQALRHALASAYDEKFGTCDLLVMPTAPMKATIIPDADATLSEYINRAMENITNACPFNVTGHPAINVPCAMSEGLPVGMMLIGRKFDELTLLRAAYAFEQNIFKPPSPPHC